MEPYDVEVDQQLMEELDSFLQEINVLPVEVPEVSFRKIYIFLKKWKYCTFSQFCTCSDQKVRQTLYYFFQKLSFIYYVYSNLITLLSIASGF